MTIGDLARIVGVSVRAIRYYEEQGLLHSERSPRGQRLYEPGAMWRVQTIQRLYAAGLSSSAIRNLGTCLAPRTVTPGQIDQLREGLRQLDEKFAELHAMRERLIDILEAVKADSDGVAIAHILPGPPNDETTDLQLTST